MDHLSSYKLESVVPYNVILFYSKTSIASKSNEYRFSGILKVPLYTLSHTVITAEQYMRFDFDLCQVLLYYSNYSHSIILKGGNTIFRVIG